jgi:hypothetical protein
LGIFDRFFGKSKQKQAEQYVYEDSWHPFFTQEIAIAMLRQIPEGWDSAYLVLEPTDKGFGTGLSHSAIMRKFSPDLALRDGDFVTPGMELMATTRKFELGAIERHAEFKRFILSAQYDGKQWGINTEFEYDD